MGCIVAHSSGPTLRQIPPKHWCPFDFCLTVRHQLGKVIQMNQLDATMIY